MGQLEQWQIVGRQELVNCFKNDVGIWLVYTASNARGAPIHTTLLVWIIEAKKDLSPVEKFYKRYKAMVVMVYRVV